MADGSVAQAAAVIAMAGKFPGAGNLEAFWRNLESSRCLIRRFSGAELRAAELRAAGVDPSLLTDTNRVWAAAVLDAIELFDAGFFGFKRSEAERLPPHQRLFLECAMEVLETAGYGGEDAGRTGLFVGAGPSTCAHDALAESPISDCLAMVTERLGLQGPGVSVDNACASSLVAVHLACESLLAGECDMALAGGTAVAVPQPQGFYAQDADILSPDGRCRPFDARANGIVTGSGVGVVALKRLEDAQRDGDQILAVVRGSAMNQSASDVATADAASQGEVVRAALKRANVAAETIQYVETHGTGIAAWDAAELEAIGEVLGGLCSIGSLKASVGHLCEASGIAALIKTVLGLQHGQLPASLPIEQPSDELQAVGLKVNTERVPWPKSETPRRAGVNAFGFGGTNAHVVLEEAPAAEPSGESRPWKLVTLSARTKPALEELTDAVAAHIEADPETNLADLAYTMQVGRRDYVQRRFVVCEQGAEANELLKSRKSGTVWTAEQTGVDREVAFLFSGVGGQFAGMTHGLYESEPTFREAVDLCAEMVHESLGQDVRKTLYAEPAAEARPSQGLDLRAMMGRGKSSSASKDPLRRTMLGHSCLFTVEYGLVQLLTEWGIRPTALIGHSLGEYLAACVAGVFPLEDALRLLVHRAKLLDALPEGTMLAVALGEKDVRPFLTEGLYLAAINGAQAVVVSGEVPAVEGLEKRFLEEGVAFRRMPASHAFHSPLIEAAAPELVEKFKEVELKPPSIPLISCATGKWITPEEVTDPQYWATQMCHKVRFEEGLRCLLESGDHFLLEVGPGETLATLAKQHPACRKERIGLVQGTVRSVHEQIDDQAYLLNALGRLWLGGVTPDWSGFHRRERRRRIPLPTTPLQRQRYWIEPTPKPSAVLPDAATETPGAEDAAEAVTAKRKDLGEWFYRRAWKESPGPDRASGGGCCVVLTDGSDIGAELAKSIRAAECDVVTVAPGDGFEQVDDHSFRVPPAETDDFVELFRAIRASKRTVRNVVVLWPVEMPKTEPAAGDPKEGNPAETIENAVNRGLGTLLTVVQGIEDNTMDSCDVVVVTDNLHDVTGTEQGRPLDATVLGPCRVAELESNRIRCRNVDVDASRGDRAAAIESLTRELLDGSPEPLVALRGRQRWIETYEPTSLPEVAKGASPYREGGVYLITGGLGSLGLAVAEHLARSCKAKLVLTSRTGPPEADELMSGATREIQEKLKAISAAGGEVLALAADVIDVGEMREAVATAKERFGEIHGVFHLAGVPGVGLMQLTGPDGAFDVLLPKVAGTMVLEQVLEDTPLDFFVAFSSLSAITGGSPGQADYCSANAFLDAHAAAGSPLGRCCSIAWAPWQANPWEDELWGFPEEARKVLLLRRREFGITAEEGCAALDRILASDQANVVVAPRDLRQIVAETRGLSVPAILERVRVERQSQPKLERPDLEDEYAVPETPLQRQIAAVWQDVLHIEKVGLDDDFYELGGNSLIGLQLTSRLREELQNDKVTARLLYESPSVRFMAESLEEE